MQSYPLSVVYSPPPCIICDCLQFYLPLNSFIHYIPLLLLPEIKLRVATILEIVDSIFLDPTIILWSNSFKLCPCTMFTSTKLLLFLLCHTYVIWLNPFLQVLLQLKLYKLAFNHVKF